MTNHPRRPGRRKHQRQVAARPTFSPFPCPYCRGMAVHTAACVTHVWQATRDQLAALQRSVALAIALPADTEGTAR